MMGWIRSSARVSQGALLSVRGFSCLALLNVLAIAFTQAAPNCRKVSIEGEVSGGSEWRHPIGEGWVFRIVPVPALASDYSGWDLVVDREQPAGFPDALYLATPPYDSINQREIGTTFGLRAQDAIGWNPRAFRFLTAPRALAEAQALYALAHRAKPTQAGQSASAMTRLGQTRRQSAAGELRILDARLIPGLADPAPFALEWARSAYQTPHEIASPPVGRSLPRGSLLWMKFSVTLWLPAQWKLPGPVSSVVGPCEN